VCSREEKLSHFNRENNYMEICRTQWAGCNTYTTLIFQFVFIISNQKNIGHLFSLQDIEFHIEIWKKGHAVKIFQLLNEVFSDIEPLPEPMTTTKLMMMRKMNEWAEIMDVSSFNSLCPSDVLYN
jgi:hypothetical protein